jgi:hypothetical protein
MRWDVPLLFEEEQLKASYIKSKLFFSSGTSEVAGVILVSR